MTSDDGIRFSYVVLVFGFLGIERVGCRNSCLFALVSLMTSNQAVINQSSLWTLTAVQRINHQEALCCFRRSFQSLWICINYMRYQFFFEIFGQETSYLHILFHEPPFFTSLLIRLSNPCPQLVPCQGTSYGPSATAQLLEDATYGEGIAHED